MLTYPKSVAKLSCTFQILVSEGVLLIVVNSLLRTISELWSENGANSPSQYGVGHKIREFLVRIELGVQLFLGEHIESYTFK